MKNYHAPDEKGFSANTADFMLPKPLIPPCKELADAYKAAKNDPSFWEEFHPDLKHYVGRPSPFTMPRVCPSIWAVRKSG